MGLSLAMLRRREHDPHLPNARHPRDSTNGTYALASNSRPFGRGDPFFLEELIRDLVESDGLEGEGGALRAAAPIDEVALPGTVQAVLAARIDRLAEPDKTVLQAAAVIGYQFTEPLLVRARRHAVARGAAGTGQGRSPH